jgi:hypothetical protein
MKIVDKFLQKVGADKVLHFTIAALIVAWGGNFGDWGVAIGAFGALGLSVLKEKLDDTFELNDIIAAILGIMTSFILYAV